MKRSRGMGWWIRLYLNKHPDRPTIKTAAKTLGVSSRTLTNWVTGAARIPLAKLPAVSDLVRVDLGLVMQDWISHQVPDSVEVAQRLRLHIVTKEQQARLGVDARSVTWAKRVDRERASSEGKARQLRKRKAR